MTAHQQACALVAVACRWAGDGCTERFARRAAAAHEQGCAAHRAAETRRAEEARERERQQVRVPARRTLLRVLVSRVCMCP